MGVSNFTDGSLNNNRILAVHRIRKAEVSDLSFERPKDFDLDKYADDGQFGFGEA